MVGVRVDVDVKAKADIMVEFKAGVGSTTEAPAMAALASFLASEMPLISDSEGANAEIEIEAEADIGVSVESGVTPADSCSDSVRAEAVAISLAIRKPARACS